MRIANVLVLPIILFRTSVASLGADEIERMQKIMNEYVWQKKKTKPALKWSRRRWEKGGLELRDVRLMALASRCRVIQHLWKACNTDDTPPAWVCWLLRELKRALKAKDLDLQDMWDGKRRIPQNGNDPFPFKKKEDYQWKNDHFAEICARVWWTLRSRNNEGTKWANTAIFDLQQTIVDEQHTNPENTQQRARAKLQRLQEDIQALHQRYAFFCAHPRKIIRIEDMTAKMVYWTLVEAEDALIKDKRKKTGVREEKRAANGDFTREKRLRKVTMARDEKSL